MTNRIPWGPDSPGYPNRPVPAGHDVTVWFRDGSEERNSHPESWAWSDAGRLTIIAYCDHDAQDEAIRDQLGPKFKHLAPLVAAEMIPALVEGLHAQVFAVHSLGDPEASHAALADNGQIHETVHALVRSLPVRDTNSAQDEARELLAEARRQLEYLDGRFPTGTTPAVLARIDAYLNQCAAAKDQKGE